MQSPSLRSNFLIDPSELKPLLGTGVKLVNATWYMPNMNRNAWQEHLDSRITLDTVFFDHDEICDKSNPLPHTLPPLDVWIENMKKLNIPRDAPIVCYDNQGMFSVARAAWMMRYFGAQNVKILNGGLKKWVEEGGETVAGE